MQPKVEVESTLHLIEQARRGDQDALDRLFARHSEPLRRWATGRLPKWARDVADTDDLVQETLLRTFKRIGDFEPRGAGALLAYLRQAILNAIREELRRKGRRPDGTGLAGLEADRALSPLEQAIGGEAVDRYERALSRLKPGERKPSSAASKWATPTRNSERLSGSRPQTQHGRRPSGRWFAS